MSVTFALEDLEQFSGTERYYRSSMFSQNIVHTDGVNYIAMNGGAWMVDVIVSHQIKAKVNREEFQVWDFKLDGQGGCTAVCTDGNENILVEQKIPYTDLPFDLRFYLQLGSIDLVNPMWVLMLTSEY